VGYEFINREVLLEAIRLNKTQFDMKNCD
jgi:hypothetical protein